MRQAARNRSRCCYPNHQPRHCSDGAHSNKYCSDGCYSDITGACHGARHIVVIVAAVAVIFIIIKCRRGNCSDCTGAFVSDFAVYTSTGIYACSGASVAYAACSTPGTSDTGHAAPGSGRVGSGYVRLNADSCRADLR